LKERVEIEGEFRDPLVEESGCLFVCLFVICGSGDGAEFDGTDVIALLLLWVGGGGWL